MSKLTHRIFNFREDELTESYQDSVLDQKEASKKIQLRTPLRSTFSMSASIFIPFFEAFICRTVTDVMSMISDSSLREEASLLVAQEKEHMIAHRIYNSKLVENPYSIEILEAFKKEIKKLSELPIKDRVALAAIFEFLGIAAAIMAINKKVDLKHGSIYEKLTNWHAMEEIEHMDSMAKIANYILKEEQVFYKRKWLGVSNKLDSIAFFNGWYSLKYSKQISWIKKIGFNLIAWPLFMGYRWINTHRLRKYCQPNTLVSDILKNKRGLIDHDFLDAITHHGSGKNSKLKTL
jgi:hypothetical protein